MFFGPFCIFIERQVSEGLAADKRTFVDGFFSQVLGLAVPQNLRIQKQ